MKLSSMNGSTASINWCPCQGGCTGCSGQCTGCRGCMLTSTSKPWV